MTVNLLTAAQTAVILKVSKRRVLALIQAGRLPAEKVGNQMLIRPRDLEKVKDRPAGRPPKAGRPRKGSA